MTILIKTILYIITLLLKGHSLQRACLQPVTKIYTLHVPHKRTPPPLAEIDEQAFSGYGSRVVDVGRTEITHYKEEQEELEAWEAERDGAAPQPQQGDGTEVAAAGGGELALGLAEAVARRRRQQQHSLWCCGGGRSRAVTCYPFKRVRRSVFGLPVMSPRSRVVGW